jgi:hypothetical protein
MVTELNGGLYEQHSGYATTSSLGNTLETQHQELAPPKKKAPGLKKNLTSKVSAARGDAVLG